MGANVLTSYPAGQAHPQPTSNPRVYYDNLCCLDTKWQLALEVVICEHQLLSFDRVLATGLVMAVT